MRKVTPSRREGDVWKNGSKENVELYCMEKKLALTKST